MALTEAKVRNAKPAEKSVKLTDGNGMHLLVQSNGSKYWRYCWWFGALADEANVPVTLSVLNGNRAIMLYQRVSFKVVDSDDIALKMKRRPVKRQQPFE